MPRYNDLTKHLNQSTIFCSNLGFGEQAVILGDIKKGIYITSNITKARDIKIQLDALNINNCLIDDFDKPFTLSKFSSSDNKFDLISAIYELCFFDTIIISTPQILHTFIPDLEQFKQNVICLNKDCEYDILSLEKQLVKLGYTKVETVLNKGEFSVRGDVLDIFNTIHSAPVRLDFYFDLLESITYFDHLTFEKLEKINHIDIAPNKLIFDEDIVNAVREYKLDNTISDIIFTLDRNEEVPLEFLYKFNKNITNFAKLNLPIIINNHLEVETNYNKFCLSLISQINNIFTLELVKNKYLENLNLNKNQKNNEKYSFFDDFLHNFSKNLIFFENYDINNTEIKNKFDNVINYNFNTVNFESFLYNLENLSKDLSPYLEKQIYLCLDNADTLKNIKKIFLDKNINFSTNKNNKGIILTELKIPFNICFDDEVKFYIGSTNFAHKKANKSTTVAPVKYLPKTGEYVVHSTHGIGKCEGIININVGGVDKEFFKLIYRNGDSLYVPYENADCLSLYMAEGSNVKLNKLGGKEFFNEKMRTIKSIEDMSGELLELYAKRKSVKGFKYSEDDYLYTEFENAFTFNETADQLQAINDIKADMHSGKVMDRLICGDVGFGKTEVAMRAIFKAVENNKQVAMLAPTTILSLQHFLTAQERLKDFGVNVKMLNRFVPLKEQKEILQDLRSGKVNVVCGTHRLLSKDVVFCDLGLLVLDEEQRFGVKHKEQIKQLKNNVNVLSLSATPIPRTLSMSLMNIRDISIINTPPTNRLPVKTYVLAYNKEIILNAINDEINRNGQVLVVYNNIENIYKLTEDLKNSLKNPKAKFDVAHGQMSEIALENAVKRLYDKETNVFVSTTLIENGVDLPMANTLIVIDSDRLGLSQMYQLRGRVGRSGEQAYAYFTYNKTLTEEAMSRLQAIAENTELGSGFKIAMRDLQIRGAGELLGKVQHGHMIKIGYDMYCKLLNDTLKKLKGEKVETARDIKIDIALTSKIPYNFVADETERLKIISKISNIVDKNSHRDIINSLLLSYGKLPNEIYQLASIALLKALASKNKVKQITLNKNRYAIMFYSDVNLEKLLDRANKSAFRFEKGALPCITLDVKQFSVVTALNYSIEFLNGQTM